MDKTVRTWVSDCVADYDNMLIELLNKHGVPITRENAASFVGDLRILEIQEPTINGQAIICEYMGKEVCRLNKWLDTEHTENGVRIVQHIVEVEDKGV